MREGKDEAVEAGSEALHSTEEVLRRLFYPQPPIVIPNHNIVEQAKDKAASLPQRVGDLFTGGTNIKPSEESEEKQKTAQQQQGY